LLLLTAACAGADLGVHHGVVLLLVRRERFLCRELVCDRPIIVGEHALVQLVWHRMLLLGCEQRLLQLLELEVFTLQLLEVLASTHARLLHYCGEGVLTVDQRRGTLVQIGCLVRLVGVRLLEIYRLPALDGRPKRRGVTLRHGFSHDGLIRQGEVFNCTLLHSLAKPARLSGQKAIWCVQG